MSEAKKKPAVNGEYRKPIGLRYDLIEARFLEGMARIMGAGSVKYGDNNWQKGLTGCNSGLNHALKHIGEYQQNAVNEYGDKATHLEQAAVNLMFEAYFCRLAEEE